MLDMPTFRATYCTLRSVLLRRYAASVSCWLSLICENVYRFLLDQAAEIAGAITRIARNAFERAVAVTSLNMIQNRHDAFVRHDRLVISCGASVQSSYENKE